MDGDNQEKGKSGGTPITDPAVLAAIDFLNDYWGRPHARPPPPHSREEQVAISVLAEYIRSRPQPPSV